jgi:hypothetical protein
MNGIPWMNRPKRLRPAEGPLPSNSAKIRKTQDVLIYCARKRSALLDDLNPLKYIFEFLSKFALTRPTTLETVREAPLGFQGALASLPIALSRRSITGLVQSFHPEFAVERGQSFPTVTMPMPMPKPSSRLSPSKLPISPAATNPARGVQVPLGSAVEIHYPPQPVVIGPKAIDPSRLLLIRDMATPDIRQ